MKLRSKVLISWLGLELLAIPFAPLAFATFKDHISFSVAQKVVVQQLQPEAGKQQFLVASNAPFAVISEGVITDMQVSVSASGNAAGISYGQKAQLPGDAKACNMPSTITSSRIYTAHQKTARARGDVIEQSVLITVTYDPAMRPDISVRTMDALDGKSVFLALPCENVTS